MTPWRCLVRWYRPEMTLWEQKKVAWRMEPTDRELDWQIAMARASEHLTREKSDIRACEHCKLLVLLMAVALVATILWAVVPW